MKKHFVVFYSPGTFLAERTVKEIDAWSTEDAVEMSKSIVERYDARPYAFQFVTRERKEQDFDSKETARSCMYFLGGRIRTVEDLEADGEDHRILISNMKTNGWDRVIQSTHGWSWTQPLMDGDIVLEVS